jgi:hypothetical protein
MSFFKNIKMRLLPPSSKSFHTAVNAQKALTEQLVNQISGLTQKYNALESLVLKSLQYNREFKTLIELQLNEKSNECSQQIMQLKNELDSVYYSKRLFQAIQMCISASIEHQKSFSGYKNKHNGSAIVICGAGPTLNNYEPVENAIHLALNRSFLLKKVNFDYIFCGDFRGVAHIQNELKEYKGNNCVKFFAYQNEYTASFPESFAIECKALRFYTDYTISLHNDYGHDLSTSKMAVDILTTPLGNFWSTAFSAMQFALYTNPSKIYLVGCDCQGGHFNNINLSVDEVKIDIQNRDGAWYTNGTVNETLYSLWSGVKEFASVYYPETEIISMNPIGLRGLFKDEYTESYLTEHEEILSN